MGRPQRLSECCKKDFYSCPESKSDSSVVQPAVQYLTDMSAISWQVRRIWIQLRRWSSYSKVTEGWLRLETEIHVDVPKHLQHVSKVKNTVMPWNLLFEIRGNFKQRTPIYYRRTQHKTTFQFSFCPQKWLPYFTTHKPVFLISLNKRTSCPNSVSNYTHLFGNFFLTLFVSRVLDVFSRV
jgi:hypothetical protein